MSSTTPKIGDTITASVTYRNSSSAPLSLLTLLITARPPGGTNSGGPFRDFTPSTSATTVQAGASVTRTSTLAFTSSDATGQWRVYSTYQDATGYHDGAQVTFTLSAATPTPPPTNTPNPPATTTPDPAPSTVAITSGTWTGMKMGMNFWFIAPGWGEEPWKANFNFANATIPAINAASDPWNPTFLADLNEAKYSVLRFMDFGSTNNSTVRNWADRNLITSAGNADYSPDGKGIAYEWMFDLCNRVEADCWITVPHLTIETYEANATNNYYTELAKLAKARLNPGLKLYIEYSNETWNGQFSQYAYLSRRGIANGYAASTEGYTASFHFHVYASVRMYEAFLSVYGANDISRVKWVVAGQLGSDWGTQQQVAALKNTTINPNRRTPAYHAISNYVGHSVDGGASNAVQAFRADMAEMYKNAVTQRNTAVDGGMRLIAYEGGQHITTNAATFSRRSEIYQLYNEWIAQIAQVYDETAHYAGTGIWDAGGAWSAKTRPGQSLNEAPKARAIVEYIRAHRR